MDTLERRVAQRNRPAYWDRACEHLMRRDRILRKLIPAFGDESIAPRRSPFATLARIVIGQQISPALGRDLWGRLVRDCGADPSPACIAAFDEASLHAMGLSRRKAQYLLDLAGYFQADGGEADCWDGMDDAAVIAELCTIRGVGRWSAEMFLIFNLGRPDVLPLDDTALLKAISRHYFSGEPVSRFEAREVAQAWAPWRTVASWYLWRSMEAAAIEY
ncbi:DNA-3-methyladenine glycosylase family protein [Castellaniella sp. S9]|uniref:DNA-3-methyladenine glycosylase family protein n=1 Tax=Castellaniella sp. S9 TaxID=2993652 RepID=UPI0022B4F1D8|nr:DNA-3-methyladenine glycosylase 2 family protein [Castellaniella sp. S9]